MCLLIEFRTSSKYFISKTLIMRRMCNLNLLFIVFIYNYLFRQSAEYYTSVLYSEIFYMLE